MKNIIFTPIESLVSLSGPVANVFVKELRILFIGCVSKRSGKLNACKPNKEDFWFNGNSHNLSNLISAPISGVLLIAHNTALPDEGTGKPSLLVKDVTTNTGVCLTDFTEQNERRDERPIAELFSPISPSLLKRGSGETDFFTSLFNFALSCWLLILVFFIASCQQPKQQPENLKYEITFTFGVVGYVYDCDRYVKTGNTYQLYVNNKLIKTFDVGSNVLVEIENK